MLLTFCRRIACCLALWCCCGGAIAAELTPTETRWIKGIGPVIAFARDEKLPLDVIVQPQPTPGAAPLALGFVDGRCKLVLSMRGNPAAQTTLDEIEPALLDATLELMAAHELGHCRRYLDGAWYGAPASFDAAAAEAAEGGDPAAQREEGYGDLVGLAWVERRHPARYAAIHAWLMRERSADRVPGSPHDTVAWVALAQQGVGAGHTSIFTAAHTLWRAALGAPAQAPAVRR